MQSAAQRVLDRDDVIDYIITASVVQFAHSVIDFVDSALDFDVVGVDVGVAFGFSVLLVCGSHSAFVVGMGLASGLQSFFVLSIPESGVFSFFIFSRLVVLSLLFVEMLSGFWSEHCSTYRLTGNTRLVRREAWR